MSDQTDDLSPEAVEALCFSAFRGEDMALDNLVQAARKLSVALTVVEATLRHVIAERDQTFALMLARADAERERAERLEGDAKSLIEIVEGIGVLKHGTWRNDRGTRLKDETAWVDFYVSAWRAALAPQAGEGEGRKPRPDVRPVNPEDGGDGA